MNDNIENAKVLHRNREDSFDVAHIYSRKSYTHGLILIWYVIRRIRWLSVILIIQTYHFWRIPCSYCQKTCILQDILLTRLLGFHIYEKHDYCFHIYSFTFFFSRKHEFMLFQPNSFVQYQNYLNNVEKYGLSNLVMKLDPYLIISIYRLRHLKTETLLVDTRCLQSGYLTRSN